MKNERLLTLLLLLLENKQMTAPKLAERLEVSVRTIYRDVDSLSQAGVPITTLTGVKGGIRIMENYKLDKQFFSTPDLISLFIGLNSINKQVQSKQNQYTLEKLKALVPSNVQAEIQKKSEQIVIDPTPWTKKSEDTPLFATIQNALDKQQLLSFSYENRNGEYSTRIIEPYRLFYKEISWYLQGYCCEKQDFRVFKLSRMQKLHVMEDTFSARPFPSLAFEKTEASAKQFIQITLEADFFVKEQLSQRFDLSSITFNEKTETFLLQFPFIPDEFGYQLILSFGTHCKCIAPAFVQKELIKRTAEIIQLYQTN